MSVDTWKSPTTQYGRDQVALRIAAQKFQIWYQQNKDKFFAFT